MPRKKTKASPTTLDPAYEPTEFEKQLLAARSERRKVKPPAPRLNVVNKNGVTEVSVDHPDPQLGGIRLLDAFATDDGDFFNGVVNQLINVATKGKDANEKDVNFMLAMVKGIDPRDPVESLLASQMAAVHSLSMTFARRLGNVDNIAQQDSAERAFNKLTRTFAVQMDTLKRYRSKGEQRMVVQHQHLNVAANNAQVNVNGQPQGGGAATFSEDQPHEPKSERVSYEPGTAMPGEIEADQTGLPRTRRARI